MFIHRSVKANADFSSAEIGSFLETNSFRRNASGSGLFFFKKKELNKRNTEELCFISSPYFLYVLW